MTRIEERSCTVATPLAWWFTSVVVISIAAMAPVHVGVADRCLELRPTNDFLLRHARFDAQAYVHIARNGYEYDPASPSTVAFFPGFPLAIASVSTVTGCREELAGFVISNAAFLLAMIALHRYFAYRPIQTPERSQWWTYAAITVFPSSMFFHVCYSESLFLLLVVLVLTATHRGLTVATAILIGIATAVRPVGIVLVPCVWWLAATTYGRTFAAAVAAIALTCVSLSGLLAYMMYLWCEFGNPLAFAQTQQNYNFCPTLGAAQRSLALITLEPIWSAYVPAAPGYWHRISPDPPLPFNLQFANPIWFVVAAVALAWGWRTRTLAPIEVIVAAGMLLMVYVLRSYEMAMASQTRFVAVILPVHLVVGAWFARLPTPLAISAATALLAIQTGYAFYFSCCFLII